MVLIDDLFSDAVIDTNDEAYVKRAKSVHVVRCRSLDATRARINGDLYATGATIGIKLFAIGARISGTLDATGARIGGDLFADGATISGGLLAREATIGGSLFATRARIGGDLFATDATISGGLFATRATISGGLLATGAMIGGDLFALGARIAGIRIGEPTAAERELVARIAESIRRGELNLDMDLWHGADWHPEAAPGDYCGTTHCFAGAAQCLSTDPAIRRMEPLEAGRKLLPNYSHLFFAPRKIVARAIGLGPGVRE